MLVMPFIGMSGKFRGLTVDLGIGANYTATQTGAETNVILTFKTDGTWEITFGAGDTGGGSPLTGTWLVAGGSPELYEIRYTPSNQVNTPVIVNDAAAFTAVSANRLVSVSRTGADASADILVELREIADLTVSVSDTTNFAANGAP